jgi:hypothetical protein
MGLRTCPAPKTFAHHAYRVRRRERKADPQEAIHYLIIYRGAALDLAIQFPRLRRISGERNEYENKFN